MAPLSFPLDELIPLLEKLSGPTGWSILRGRMPGEVGIHIVNVRAGGQYIAGEAAPTLEEAERRAFAKVRGWIREQDRIAKEMTALLAKSIQREKARKKR